MLGTSVELELAMDELRAVARFALVCAEPALGIYTIAVPDDDRPALALDAARDFADGARRSNQQRTAATAAHRAAREAPTEAARHAAIAAGDAAAAAYLHPLYKATQVRHILGAAAHAARAAELAAGNDPMVAEHALIAAASRATPVVHHVLTRYPRAPEGRNRVGMLLSQLDRTLRDRPVATCDPHGRPCGPADDPHPIGEVDTPVEHPDGLRVVENGG